MMVQVSTDGISWRHEPMPMSSVYISSAVLFSVSVYTVLLARLPSKTESMPNSAGGQPRGICHRIQTGDSVENPLWALEATWKKAVNLPGTA